MNARDEMHVLAEHVQVLFSVERLVCFYLEPEVFAWLVLRKNKVHTEVTEKLRRNNLFRHRETKSLANSKLTEKSDTERIRVAESGEAVLNLAGAYRAEDRATMLFS